MSARAPGQAARPGHPDRLRVARAWARLGGGLAVEPLAEPVDLEALVADTARVARDEPRAFWVAASWLAAHHALVDTRRLGAALAALACEDRVASAVAGALLSVALKAAPGAASLGAAVARCRPVAPAQPLFAVAERTPALLPFLEEDAVPAVSRWGLWVDEVTLKPEAIRPVAWVVEACPELRLRATLGPGLDAAVLLWLLAPASNDADHANGATVAAAARALGATYAATHQAVDRLVGRGLAVRGSPAPGAPGRRVPLRPTAFAARVAEGGRRTAPPARGHEGPVNRRVRKGDGAGKRARATRPAD